MSLLAEERKRVIAELIEKQGKVKVNDLAKDFDVSTETIRRYLEELESEKKLKKVYGGAVKVSDEKEEPALFEREIIRIEEKQCIAQKAVSSINKNDVIFIDEGSTTLQMVRPLCDCPNVTVITNSFPVASLLISYANKNLFDGEVIFIGGSVRSKHYRSSGALAEQMAKEFYVNKAFISIDGISAEEGITCYDLEKAVLSKILIQNAKEVYVLADHSKIGSRANYKMVPIDKVDKIISNADKPADWDILCDWIQC
ncbi:MAG: DeoR/GlpR family DNA-binding transcription regulator [Bacillota bacterium]|jgi:DeoR/GlpR family transcriptional regulator of sugar metabolism